MNTRKSSVECFADKVAKEFSLKEMRSIWKAGNLNSWMGAFRIWAAGRSFSAAELHEALHLRIFNTSLYRNACDEGAAL